MSLETEPRETEARLFTVPVEPTEFLVRSPGGTNVTASRWIDVLRLLRKQRIATTADTLHVVMDTNAAWNVQGWEINPQAVSDDMDDLLVPLASRLKSADIDRAYTITVTKWQLDLGPRPGSFTSFDKLLDSAETHYDGSRDKNQAAWLVTASEFAPLDNQKVRELAGREDEEVVEEEVPETSEQALDEWITGSKTDSDRVVHENPAAAFASRMESRKKESAPALEGWRGSMNRTFKTKLNPGPHEQQIRLWRSLVQKSLSEHRCIAVANLKGGVGKSTIDYLICAILGRIRGGNILYWDNNENSGNIVERAIVPENLDVKAAIDLFYDIELFENAELSHQLKRYVLSQGDNRFYLLPSQNEAATKQVIDGAAFERMYEILRRFYDLMVVDTGNASNAGTWQASINQADQIVLAAANKEDSFRGAMKTIKALQDQGHADKLANSVAVFSETVDPRQAKLTTKEYLESLTPHVRDVVVVPYDGSLATGGKINFDTLSKATQEAYLHAAASIVDGLN